MSDVHTTPLKTETFGSFLSMTCMNMMCQVPYTKILNGFRTVRRYCMSHMDYFYCTFLSVLELNCPLVTVSLHCMNILQKFYFCVPQKKIQVGNIMRMNKLNDENYFSFLGEL